MNQLKKQEDSEREFFSVFSRSLRDSQEVERMRQEKTKYLSLIGSIVGALLGIIGTSINHAMKRNDFKKILEAIETSSQSQELMIDKVLKDVKFSNESSSPPSLSVKPSQTTAQEQSSPATPPTIPFETQIESLIQTTESNLEFKMKMNALATVAALYALFAFTVPLILKFIGD